MTSNETVYSLVQLTCLSVACLALETAHTKSISYRINPETKTPYAGIEGILLLCHLTFKHIVLHNKLMCFTYN